MELQTKYIKLLEEKVERLEKELEYFNDSKQYTFTLPDGYKYVNGPSCSTVLDYAKDMANSYPNVNPHMKK